MEQSSAWSRWTPTPTALGYSLESLRDLELVPLTTPQAQEGYYIHHSLQKLFKLINEGHGFAASLNLDGPVHDTFEMRGLHSPLFDIDRTPLLKGVKFRNKVLQEVLQLLSLSKEGNRTSRGRVSYAQLGINQLGAVYEGLMSYSGFFAKEELFEVRHHKEVDDPDARTFFVPVTDEEKYNDNEFVRDESGGKVRHERGTFLFRLAGRDREKSASYYTPEVLTQCLVKYTLKERLEALTADEILELTVLEPAMGSRCVPERGDQSAC